MTKKLITEKVKGHSSIDFEGTIESVVDNIFRLRDQALEAGYTDLYIDTDNYPWSYYEDKEYHYLYGSRIETDKEYNQRLKKEEVAKEKAKEQKALKDAKDRAEYERLKKKFERK